MKKFALALLIAPMILSSISQVQQAQAADANNIKDQISQIQNSGYSDIDKVTSMLDLYDAQVKSQYELQDKMAQLKAETDAKQKDFDTLDGQVKDNKSKIDALSTQITDVQKSITDTQDKIDKETKRLNKLKESIDARKEQIADMYRSLQLKGYGQGGDVVNVLLDAHSLTDAIGNTFGVVKLLGYVKDQVVTLKAQIKEQKEVKQNIVKLRHELQSKKDSLTTARTDADHQNRDLVTKQNEITTNRNQINDEIKSADAQQEQAKQDALEVQKEFNSLADTLIKSEDKIKDMIANTTDANKKKMLQDLLDRINQLKPVDSGSSATGAGGDSSVTPGFDYDVKNLDEARQKLIEVAKTQLGVPYVWGGTTPDSALDCSGLTQYVYKKALGISIGRVTTQQQTAGHEVSASDLKAGDLIFWGEPSYHVAMYIGDGVYIQAPQPGQNVSYSRYNISGASHIRRIIK